MAGLCELWMAGVAEASAALGGRSCVPASPPGRSPVFRHRLLGRPQNVTVPPYLREGQKGKEEISESCQALDGVKSEHLKMDLPKPGTNGIELARENGRCP